jgi:eukaryotic-like serine/threonine-protein kinase
LVVPATAENRVSDAVFSYSEIIHAKTKSLLAFSPDVNFPRVGDRFQGFDLIGELGSGTFGRVYLAKQPAVGDRLVALKVASDIVGECQALSQLRHTNIVPIYSVHEDPARPHWKALCMPYLGGTTLQSILGELQSSGTPNKGSAMAASWRKLKTTVRNHVEETLVKPAFQGAPPTSVDRPSRRPRLARALTTFERIENENFVDAVLEIAAALADGLAHAHDQGILHRDLKPANVIITDDGEPMLVDFNLSEDVKQRTDNLWSMAGGTLPYMSPEQIDEYLRTPTVVDQRSDLYSLGVIVFELLTGKLPFPSATSGKGVWQDARAARMKSPPTTRELNRAVSRRVDVVIRKCLECNPAKRYASARELHDDLKCCLKARPLVHARDPYLHERVGLWAERHAPKLFACGLSIFAAFFAFSAYSLNEFEARRDAGLAWTAARPSIDRSRYDLAEAVIDRRAFDEVRSKALEHLAPFDDGVDLESNKRFQRIGLEERQELKRHASTIAVLAAGASLIEAGAKDGDARHAAVAEAERWTKRVERFVGNGNSKTALLLKATVLESAGSPGAADAMRQAETAKPIDPMDGELASLVYAVQRKFSKAKSLLTENEAQSPDPIFSAFIGGFCLRELGEAQRAVQAWGFCAHERPTDPQFRRLMGLTQNRFMKSVFRSPVAALRNLDASVALDSSDAESLLARAYVYKSINQQADAMQDAKDALRVGFSPFYTWSAIKRLAGTSDPAAAEEADSELKNHSPATFEDWLELGKHGETPEKRLAGCRKAIALRPWSIEANAEYLEQLIENSTVGDEAVKAVKRARRVAPDLWKLRGRCGQLLAIQGLDEQAFQEAEELLSQSCFRNQRLSTATAVFVEVASKKPTEVEKIAARLSAALEAHRVTIGQWQAAMAKNPLDSPHFEELSRLVLASSQTTEN